LPTTARGIWTPSDTDAVDFTTHLATMAGTIDTALANGANVYRGTAAQRVSFLGSASAGMLWQDTDSIKMIWRKDGAAWVPAVWRWQGTTAQMNSFAASAPAGFEWHNSTDSNSYVMLGGIWLLASGSFSARLTTEQSLSGGWAVVTPLAFANNSCGATVSGGAITIAHPGKVLFSGVYQNNQSPSTPMSTAATLNSASPSTGASTIIDGASNSNGLSSSRTLIVAPGDVLRLFMAGVGGMRATQKSGIDLTYIR
jgi:hypothetical protein